MTEQAKLFENTFNKERGRLLGFIRKFVSSLEDAEDILQDVFYQYMTYENSGIIEKISSWLFKTARNKIIDAGRKKRAQSFSQSISLLNEFEEFSIEDFLPSFGFTPEELFLQDEFNKVFFDALNELPDEQKDVFVMNEIEGFSFKEISEITGLGINTLLSRKHYAAKQLKKKLNNYLNG